MKAVQSKHSNIDEDINIVKKRAKYVSVHKDINFVCFTLSPRIIWQTSLLIFSTSYPQLI